MVEVLACTTDRLGLEIRRCRNFLIRYLITFYQSFVSVDWIIFIQEIKYLFSTTNILLLGKLVDMTRFTVESDTLDLRSAD